MTYLVASYIEGDPPPTPRKCTWRVYAVIPTEHPWHDLRVGHPGLPSQWDWCEARTDLCASVARPDLASAGRWLGRAADSELHALALGECVADAGSRAWPSNLGVYDLQPLLLDPRQELREFALGLLPSIDAGSNRGRHAPLVGAWCVTVTMVIRSDNGYRGVHPPTAGLELLLDAAGNHYLRYAWSLRERTELLPHDWLPVEDRAWAEWESLCSGEEGRQMAGRVSAGRTSVEREYLRCRAFLVRIDGQLSPASPMER